MKFVAHMGHWKGSHFNTLPAFAAAAAHPECGRKLTGIELDIRSTADGKIVVFHDNSLPVNGPAALVESITYGELCRAVAAQFPGVVVPLLDEVFDCVGHRLELLVEIKDAGYDKERFFGSLYASIRRYNPQGDVIIHSFSPGIMEAVMHRFKRPSVRYGALFSKADDIAKFPPVLLGQMDYVHPQWQGLIEGEERFRELDRPFNVWTVNSKADLALVMKLSCVPMISAVMTDDLDLLLTDGV